MSPRTLTLWIAGLCAALALVTVTTIMVVRSGDKGQVSAQVPTPIQSGLSGVAVQGSGAALVKPDVVKMTTGVEERAQTVTAAQAQASAKLEAIKKAVTDKGVKPEDIVTTSYEIYPNYVYVNQQPPRLDGYIVRSQLTLTIRDTTKAGPVIDAVGNAGANLVGGIQFTLENNSDAVKQARQAAMDDAKTKAQQLAQFGGFTLGSVISVSDLGSNTPPKVATGSGGRDAAGIAAAPVAAPAPDTVIEGGQFKVIVNVQVVYAISK